MREATIFIQMNLLIILDIDLLNPFRGCEYHIIAILVGLYTLNFESNILESPKLIVDRHRFLSINYNKVVGCHVSLQT